MKQIVIIRPLSTASMTTPKGIAVSLPYCPEVEGAPGIRDPRTETAPRRGIVSPQETPLERFRAALREVIEDAGA